MLGLSIIKTSKLREYKYTIRKQVKEIESLSNQVIDISKKLEEITPKRGAKGRFEKK